MSCTRLAGFPSSNVLLSITCLFSFFVYLSDVNTSNPDKKSIMMYLMCFQGIGRDASIYFFETTSTLSNWCWLSHFQFLLALVVVQMVTIHLKQNMFWIRNCILKPQIFFCVVEKNIYLWPFQEIRYNCYRQQVC